MSETAAATVIIGDPEDPQGHPEDRHVPVGELFGWIYRFFYSKTVGLILILVFAVYALIGSVIAQTSHDTWADPAGRAQFLSQMEELYGGWTPVLSALGFFHVFTSTGFYVVVALLALSILACTVHRIPELIKRKRNPRLHVSAKFFDRARYRAQIPTTAGPETASEAAAKVLRGQRFRVLPDPRAEGKAFYADRNAWAGIGTVIAHLSFIIILAAFVISATWGIEEELAIPVGGSVPAAGGLTAHAVSFQDSYAPDGQPIDYVTELQLLDGDEVVAEQEVRVNTPLDFEGFRYHQQSFGIAADVNVAGAGGETLYAEAVPLMWTSNGGQNSVGRFDLPGTDLEIIVVTAASGATASPVPLGAALFEVYQKESGEMLGQGLVAQGQSEEFGEYTFSFERERQYTGIRMRQDPGALWMWVGSILLVTGMSITFLFQYRRLWVRVDADPDTGGSTVRLGAVARLDYAYQRLFENMVERIEIELGAAPPPVGAEVAPRSLADEEETRNE